MNWERLPFRVIVYAESASDGAAFHSSDAIDFYYIYFIIHLRFSAPNCCVV